MKWTNSVWKQSLIMANTSAIIIICQNTGTVCLLVYASARKSCDSICLYKLLYQQQCGACIVCVCCKCAIRTQIGRQPPQYFGRYTFTGLEVSLSVCVYTVYCLHSLNHVSNINFYMPWKCSPFTALASWLDQSDSSKICLIKSVSLLQSLLWCHLS